MDISKKILEDPLNQWVFKNAGSGTYLVGGYIRDLIIGRRAYDKDYVLEKNAREFALKFARKFSGTFIELKEELTYRVALRDGQIIDFNNLEEKIEGDLLLRDYTINAIAWSPDTGILDPCRGINSLRKRTLTAISPQNLQKDPLRVLRAYRIAAQLDFAIDRQTRSYLNEYADLIARSAPERITEELFKLLNSDKALKSIELCLKDGVFNTIFNITARNIKEIQHSIALFDDYTKIQFKFNMLDDNISQGLERRGLIRLALLLSKTTNANNPLNFGYLKPSNIIKQKITEIHEALRLQKSRITDSRLYEIYCTAGTSVFETAMIISSTRTRKRDRERFIRRAEDYIRINERHLINGNEIKKALGIKEGAKIGRIQEKIKEGQFKGIFKNKSQAAQWIISNFT